MKKCIKRKKFIIGKLKNVNKFFERDFMNPEILTISIYTVIFLSGIIIGSFLNICIYRIPRGETVVTVPSSFIECGHRLSQLELVSLFSRIFLKRRCGDCKSQISPQYSIIEGVNGLLYILVFLINGFNLESIIYSLFTSALIVLAVIDWRTYEIPVKINIFILILGSLRVVLDIKNFSGYLIGFFLVSGMLLLLYIVTKRKAIGGGDIKLMAAAGLLLGWKLVILAFFIGCILGSVIHIIRMKLAGADRVLAMGPYLSAGLFIAMLWGNSFLDWY